MKYYIFTNESLVRYYIFASESTVRYYIFTGENTARYYIFTSESLKALRNNREYSLWCIQIYWYSRQIQLSFSAGTFHNTVVAAAVSIFMNWWMPEFLFLKLVEWMVLWSCIGGSIFSNYVRKLSYNSSHFYFCNIIATAYLWYCYVGRSNFIFLCFYNRLWSVYRFRLCTYFVEKQINPLSGLLYPWA